MRPFLALSATLLLAVALPGLAQDPLAARKANRTAMRDDLRWINQQQGSGDLAAIARRAGAMVARGPVFLTMFPPGSDGGDTGSRPEVWTDWPTFQQREADLETKLRELQAAAEAGDRARVQAAVRTAGAACQACHERFRKPTG